MPQVTWARHGQDPRGDIGATGALLFLLREDRTGRGGFARTGAASGRGHMSGRPNASYVDRQD